MSRRHKIAILLVATILGAVTVFMAQDAGSSNPAVEPQSQSWAPDQLDNLVAPIALYPDPLLSQMLVASTYPLEVVEATQWLKRNPGLGGEALIDAAKQQQWDPSIQALVAVPDALEKLNQDISWTTDLGNAFLAQQDDVMNAVQRMRVRAQAKGQLYSTPQQVVRTEDQGGQQAVEILPADPNVIYVPVYNPFYVWGPPVYGYYPALYYPSFGFRFGSGFDLAFCFGGWGGWGSWGWGPNWFGRSVVVDSYFFHRYGFREIYIGGFRGRTVWRHDPDHRMNIPYASSRVADRFRGASTGSRNSRWAIPDRTGTRFSGRNEGQRSRNQATQGDRFQNQPSTRYQSPRRNESSSEQSRQGRRVVPFGEESQRGSQPAQQGRSTSRAYGTSRWQGQREQNQSGSSGQQYRQSPPAARSGDWSQRSNRSIQQDRPAVQTYRAPQGGRSSQGFSAPRFGGGNSGFRGGGGFSQARNESGNRGGGNGGGRRR